MLYWEDHSLTVPCNLQEGVLICMKQYVTVRTLLVQTLKKYVTLQIIQIVVSWSTTIAEKTVSRYLLETRVLVQVLRVFECTIYGLKDLKIPVKVLGLKGLTLYFRRCLSAACGWIWFSRNVRRASKLYFFIWRAPRMWWEQNHLRFYRNLFSKNLVDKKAGCVTNIKNCYQHNEWWYVDAQFDVDAHIQTLKIISKLIKRWWYFGKIIRQR